MGPPEEPDRIRLGPAVGGGAEGVLYRAYHDGAETTMALAVKMLQPGHLDRLDEWTARWRTHVELLGRVMIPGLVRVRGGFVGPLPHPPGLADSTTASLYLLMDWVEGTPLDRWARTTTVTEPEQLLLTLVPVAAALDILHSGTSSRGVPLVHRDVKPANILIRPGGDTVLVDIGALRGLGGVGRHSGVVGTPGYLAPEVRREGRYSPASDRYALGAVAYFLLTGEQPPEAATSSDLAERFKAAPLVAERHELADHVLAMLSDDPDQRPALLGNWVAQLRRSSLFPAPAELPLPDRAPGRHPRRSRDAEPDSPAAARRRITARVLALISSVLLIPALITIVFQSRLNSETSNASTFSIELDGIVLTIGQRLPDTLDLAFVDSQEDFFFPGDIGLPVLEYRDDAGIGLILVNRVIQAIILGPQPRPAT